MELLVIIALAFLNGIFSLSEIALVSVKKQRLIQKAEQGNASARTALELLKNPERFLSAVQIGITLIGIVSGVYGGATLTNNVTPWFEGIPALAPYAETIAYVLVVTLITYISIVIGELIPKTLAMKFAEPVALFMAPFIRLVTMLASPFVWLLSLSTRIVFRVMGIKTSEEENITEEDLLHFIKTAGRQGVIDVGESEIQQNVLSFTELRARNLMTHRTEVAWIDIDDPLPDVVEQVRQSTHHKFPVCKETYDTMLGYIHAKELLERKDDPEFSLHAILKEPVYLPETVFAIDILQAFRKHRQYFGIVVDEYGAFEGVLTLHDLAEALVGDLPDAGDDLTADITTRHDGSLLVNGSTLISDLNRFWGSETVEENPLHYSTLAGFITYYLEHLPAVAEKLTYKDMVFEVIDKDGNRIDQVLITKNAG
jgi:putative hemolysin